MLLWADEILHGLFHPALDVTHAAAQYICTGHYRLVSRLVTVLVTNQLFGVSVLVFKEPLFYLTIASKSSDVGNSITVYYFSLFYFITFSILL